MFVHAVGCHGQGRKEGQTSKWECKKGYQTVLRTEYRRWWGCRHSSGPGPAWEDIKHRRILKRRRAMQKMFSPFFSSTVHLKHLKWVHSLKFMLRNFSYVKEGKRDISAWAVTQDARPSWDQGSEITLLRDRNLLIPSNECFHTNCSKQTQGPPCPKGHCVWELEINPTAQLQHSSAPKPTRVGQGEAEAHAIWEGGSKKPAPCTEEHPCRDVQTGTGEISPERRRQNGLA